MRVSLIISFVFGLGALVALTACQGVGPAAAPTVDTAATVSAAVQATSVAQASLNATVEAAARATGTAAAQMTQTVVGQATPTRPVTAQAPATPKPITPTPSAAYMTMTEEELDALIDQAVKEAVAATTAATTATTTATADGTLTAQEVQMLMTAVALSQTEINEALALAQAYYDLYSQLATETLALLQAIEQDLNSMATSMATMAQSLQQISKTMAQGQALTQAAISQLQATASKASTAAASAQAKEKNWAKTVQGELDKRASAALAVKPNNVPTDLRGAAQSVSTYIETVRAALGDNKINKNELAAISQAGANAVAGLNAHGGAQFQGLSNSINAVTKQIARGEIPKAKSSLGGLEQAARALPSVPSVPSKPGR